jgi:hypothetical protein
MPFDGSGNFTRVHNWQQDRDNGIRIVADRHDQEDDNFAQGFNQAFLRNGVVPMSGALNMNGNSIRGIAGGGAGQPTITSVLDPTSGYFSPAPAQLGIAIAGQQRGLWTAAGLAVNGIISVTGDVTVGGNLVFTGNLSVPGTLSVTGVSTFTGKTTHNGGIQSTTGVFSGAITGTSMGLSGGLGTGTLNVSGQAVFGGPLNATGSVTLLNLDVTGASSFGATINAQSNVNVAGNVIASNVNVSGSVSAATYALLNKTVLSTAGIMNVLRGGQGGVAFADNAGQEVARIDPLGLLTLGQTSADAKLRIFGANPYVEFWNGSSQRAYIQAANADTANGALYIVNTGSGPVYTQIGSTAVLDVNVGGINVTGSIRATGAIDATGYTVLGRPILGATGNTNILQGGPTGTVIARSQGDSAVSIDSNGVMVLQSTGADQKLVMRAAQPSMTFQNADGSATFATLQAAANEFQFACAKPILFFVGGTQVASIAANGNFLVGGAITAAGDITAFSDERFKTNVRKARGLAAVCAMEGVTFDHISSKRASAGVIAQELVKVAPELVHMDDRGHYSVNYGGLAAYLIEAIKDLNGIVRDGYTR